MAILSDISTKHYVIWGVIGVVVLALAGYLLFSLTHRPKPAPAEGAQRKPELARIVPQIKNIRPRRDNASEDLSQLEREHPDLKYMLPPSEADGMPFVLTDASEHANSAFKYLRQRQFQEAVNEYRMASELDPRYETVLKRTEEFVKEMHRVGFDTAKHQRVFPGQRLTYKQLYGWD